MVATAFVTMGVVVNSRTVFSLFFPPILDEFGWSRALTAATFTTGLLAANVFTPFLGVLMDRLGPRVVFPFGLVLMSLGLALATGASAPWQLHLTLGVLVAGASVFVSYMGHFAPDAELVRASARPGARHRLLGRRRGLLRAPALGPA